VPWDSICATIDSMCVMMVPRLRLKDHRSEMPPAGGAWLEEHSAVGQHMRDDRAKVQLERPSFRNASCWSCSRGADPSLHCLRRSGGHCMDSVGARFEEHRAVGQHMRHDCAKAQFEGSSVRTASYWSLARSRSSTAPAAAARGGEEHRAEGLRKHHKSCRVLACHTQFDPGKSLNCPLSTSPFWTVRVGRDRAYRARLAPTAATSGAFPGGT